MTRRPRFLVIALLFTVSAAVVAIAAAVYAVRSEWFANALRHRAIAGIERVTGGRAELGSFHYNWRTLTLELDNIIVHGTENKDAPPLFRAAAARVQLKIISLWKRDVDVSSLILEQPHVYLLFRPDGTTNIPKAKVHTAKTPEEALVDLKVGHFAINDGIIRTDFQRIPVSVRGDNLDALLTYEPAADRYGVKLFARPLRFESSQTLPVSPDLQLQAYLERNQFKVTQFSLQTSQSKLSGSLRLTNFRNPAADMQLTVRASAGEVGEVAELPELCEGEIGVTGTAHYDANSAFAFYGKVSARDLGYRSRAFSLRHVSVTSEVFVDERDINLSRLTASVLGSRVVGSASLKSFRELIVAGEFHGLDSREVAPYLTALPLPWRGTAEGPFRIEGLLGRRLQDFVLHTDATIVPVSQSIPLSGNIDVTYRQVTHAIELGPSELVVPSSRVAVSGVLGQSLAVTLDATKLGELRRALPILGLGAANMALPLSLDPNGSVHFAGTVAGPLLDPRIDGELALTHFESQGEAWDQMHGHVGLSARTARFTGLVVEQGSLHATGSGFIPLSGWTIDRRSPFRVEGQFKGGDVAKLARRFSTLKLPIARGVAAGSGTIGGTIENPSGNAKISVDSMDAYGELLNRIQFSVTSQGDDVEVAGGKIQAGPASVTFSGGYRHATGSWADGTAEVKIDSNGFPLASVSLVHKYEPELNAQFEVHGQAAFRVVRDQLQPLEADGTLTFRRVTLRGISLGTATVNAVTRGQAIDAKIAGDLRNTQVTGSAHIQIGGDYPAQGALHLAKIDLGTVATLMGQTQPLPFNGSLRGDIQLHGPLLNPSRFKGSLRIDDVEVSPILPAAAKGSLNSTDLALRNVMPIVVEAENGSAIVRSFQIGGKDTSVNLTGSIPLSPGKSMNVRADGSVNLKIFQLADPNVLAAGVSTIAASFGGTYREPTINGRLELKNASFVLNNVPNGLSDVNGTLQFDGNRATVEKLTAHSGGGDLSLAGFVSYGAGPLVYQLTGSANQVRVRYAGGISATANSSLRFSGTSEASVLSGTVTVTKASFNPSTDIGTLLANTSVPAPVNEKGFLEGVQFDVQVESSPNLQLSTYLSQDVQAEVDVRLRGTPDHPTVLGNVSVNEGDIKIFGTTYTINRGEINFQNPARVEPVLDLDLLTEAGGIAVDITVSGPLSKLNINYRSDPPLQPREIVALLTVGRTPDISSDLSSSQTTNDFSALQSGANTVLGQAFAPVSNRLSKLFGITNIKIDPLVQGITNTPQARLTVQQQISKSITVTYITNLQQTSEQIFRLEWAFSSQFSLVALRDDNGEFGVDILVKKRFK